MDLPVLLGLLICALPLASWTVQFLYAAVNRKLPPWADLMSTTAICSSLGCALYLFFVYVLFGGGITDPYEWNPNWFVIGLGSSQMVIDFNVAIDNFTSIMFVVVTIVASLVHIYSRSYMHDEERYPRFFFYLSLFSFSMLSMVLTSNLLMLFIFWELVGVCSYFLIGFFIKKKSAGDASKKAFVTNRIGDACFMAGIFLIMSNLAKQWPGEGVLSFSRIWESVALLGQGQGPWAEDPSLVVLAGILIFMGCVTKSAQFPLHVWLPDAMEGPTPVSALIHAATMVVAGVYMIIRMFPLMAGEGYMSGDYFNSPTLWVIACIGAITAIFSATIALVQSDLKKGLAYSTCSQLGYMVMAVGVGSITAAAFHLFTHAFFKACLFLGSGSVIHAVHSQEMSDMGGLKKKMPITRWTFLISCLAIAGIPFFSGLLSKEAILGQAAAFAHYTGKPLAWLPFALAGITAIMTAFYMFRLYFLTFEGKPGDQHKYEHAHESPPAMAVPLVVLAVLAVIAGGIATPAFQIGDLHVPGGPGSHWFQDRINDEVLVKNVMIEDAVTEEARAAFAAQEVHLLHDHDHHGVKDGVVEHFAHSYHAIHHPLLIFSLFAAFGGLGFAYLLYMKKRERDYVASIPPLAAYREVLKNLYYVDWFYCNRVVPTVKDVTDVALNFDKKVVDGVVNGAAKSVKNIGWVTGQIDKGVVDGSVNGAGWLAMTFGNGFRRMVSGKIQDYVKYTVVGMGVLVLVVILATTI